MSYFMEPNEMNQAIAEYLGCELLPLPQNPNQKTLQRNGCTVEIPNYSGDMNVMSEAKATLDDLQKSRYLCHLHNSNRVVGWDFSISFATAAREAEAFLRTVGKWKEAE